MLEDLKIIQLQENHKKAMNETSIAVFLFQACSCLLT